MKADMILKQDCPYISRLVTLLEEHPGGVYLVGGFLRDRVLRRPGKDLDFAVEKDALGLARRFAEEIRGAYVLLDEEHPCARVVRKDDESVWTFDFADFRAPDIHEDLRRRDFTVNTLCLNMRRLNPGEDFLTQIEDPGRALKDIEAGRVKRVSIHAFEDDPLRMMRAFSLKAVFGFRIDLATLNQIRSMSARLREVSVERVREELFKILSSERTSETFRQMDECGLLQEVIPQIRVMENCPQGGYHHLNVWEHSLETVFQLEKVIGKLKDHPDVPKYLEEDFGGGHPRRALLKLGALLHDIGKPETRRQEEGRFSFHGHEHAGQAITHHALKQLKFSTRERHAVEDMVRWHLRPGYLSNEERPTDRAVYRFFRDGKDEAVSILILSWADQRSTRGPMTSQKDQDHHRDICRRLIDEWFDRSKAVTPPPLLTGHDLIQELGLRPSPVFKKVLSAVSEAQALEQIRSREEALRLAREMVAGRPPEGS